jgi:hypothetical protein
MYHTDKPSFDRIIMGIWKMRSPGPEQKAEIIEESELKELQAEESRSLFSHEDVKMSEIFSSVLSVDVSVTFILPELVTMRSHIE